MSCIDRRSRIALAGAVLVAACAAPPPPEPAPAPAPARARPSAPAVSPSGTAGTAGATASLPPPSAVRNWNEVRQQAARRMVAASPAHTYSGAVPDQLLAIPVLEIELNGDGSVRRIDVLRTPRQAVDTLQMATDAVRRAAPYGDVSRLPKPWRFTETFLFNDDRKFKPRTLDD